MIYQTLTLSFKEQILKAQHNLLTDTLKLALYYSTANLSEDTTVYTPSDEVSGGGYSAGGVVLTGVSINTLNKVVYVNFGNASWSPASFTAAGALIYNSTNSNKSIAVLSFGNDKVASNSFVVQMPSNTYNSSLIRFL